MLVLVVLLLGFNVRHAGDHKDKGPDPRRGLKEGQSATHGESMSHLEWGGRKANQKNEGSLEY